MSVGTNIGGAPASTFQMPSATAPGGNPLAQYQLAPQGGNPMAPQQSAASIPVPASHLGPNPEAAGFGTGGFVMPTTPAPSQQQGMPQLNLQLPAQQQAPQQQFAPAPQYGAAPTPQFQPQQQPAAAPMFAAAPQQPQQFAFNDGMSLGGAAGGFVPTAGQPFPPVAPQQQPQPGVQYPGAPQFQQPAAPTPIRDDLVRQGLNVSHYRTDAELLADLGQIAASAQAIQSQAAWAAANSQAQPSGQQTPPAQGGQPQAPTAGAAPNTPTKPQAPEWNPEWNQFIRLNPQTGLYEPASVHINPMLAQKANEYKSWQRQQAEKLITDPMSVIGPDLDTRLKAIKDEAKNELRQEIAVERQRTEGAKIVDRFVEKNATTFFQSGPDGKPVVNPITGQYVFTPRGQAAMTYGTQYRQQFAARYGSQPHPADVIEHVQKSLAYDEARGVFGPPMPQQQMPGVPQFQAAAQYPAVAPAPQMYGQPPMQYPMVAPVAQPWAPQPYGVPAYGAQPQFSTPQDDMVRRAIAAQQAGYQPQPNGTIQTAMQNALAPQNPSLDFKSMLRQSAQARGISTEHFSS